MGEPRDRSFITNLSQRRAFVSEVHHPKKLGATHDMQLPFACDRRAGRAVLGSAIMISCMAEAASRAVAGTSGRGHPTDPPSR